MFKIGGSLHANPQLRGWLGTLATHGAGRVVIVPGGGPFADAVRAAQARWGYSDADAHYMALQAMDQYGRMLAAIEPRLAPAPDRARMHKLLARGRAVVCPAVAVFAGDRSIVRGWNVTSDSLAARLAGGLGAAGLALVKSVAPAGGPHRAQALAERGVVDAAFPGQIAGARFRTWWLAADAPELAGDLLAGVPGGAEILAGAATPAASGAVDQRGG